MIRKLESEFSTLDMKLVDMNGDDETDLLISRIGIDDDEAVFGEIVVFEIPKSSEFKLDCSCCNVFERLSFALDRILYFMQIYLFIT